MSTDETVQLDDAQLPVGDDETADFDSFWSQQQRQGKPFRMFGKEYRLPPRLPLAFEMESRRMKRSEKPEDVQRLVNLLLGDAAFQQLVADGLDDEQFAVLLYWGAANASGVELSMQQALDEYRQQEADKRAGKGRARSGSGKRTSGSSSKPTGR